MMFLRVGQVEVLMWLEKELISNKDATKKGQKTCDITKISMWTGEYVLYAM
jgi:hypothetical protein